MRYVMARYNDYKRDLTYRYYLTDTLFHYAHNRAMKYRYADIVEKKVKLVPEKSGNEIVADVVSRAGLKKKKKR